MNVHQMLGGIRSGMGYIGCAHHRGAAHEARSSCASPPPGSARATSTTSSSPRRRPTTAWSAEGGRPHCVERAEPSVHMAHAREDPDPRLRQPVHPAHRAAGARAGRLLRDPPSGPAAEPTSRPSRRAGIILSGGPAIVSRPRARRMRSRRLRARRAGARHLLRPAAHGEDARRPGRPRRHREYGPAEVEVLRRAGPSPAFAHGRALEGVDEPRRPGRRAAARASSRSAAPRNAPFAAAAHASKPIYGLQFHPEVVHTPQRQGDAAGVPLRRLQASAAAGR